MVTSVRIQVWMMMVSKIAAKIQNNMNKYAIVKRYKNKDLDREGFIDRNEDSQECEHGFWLMSGVEVERFAKGCGCGGSVTYLEIWRCHHFSRWRCCISSGRSNHAPSEKYHLL